MYIQVTNNQKNNEQYALSFHQGDEKALAFFYNEFHPALALFAFRYTKDRSLAEEIASGAFVKTWKLHWKLDSYNAIRAYLYKVVYRDSIHSARKENKRRTLYQKVNPAEIISDTPFDQTVRSEVHRIIHSALKDLPPGSRRIIMMHYLDGKTSGQIARELNLHPSTVNTQKKNGLKALRKILKRPLILFQKIFVRYVVPEVYC